MLLMLSNYVFFFILGIYLYQFDQTNKKIMIVCYHNNIKKNVVTPQSLLHLAARCK